MKIEKLEDGNIRITQDSGSQIIYSMSEIYEICRFADFEEIRDEVETYLTGLEECCGVAITERYLCDDIIDTITKTVQQDRISAENGDQIYEALYKHILSLTPSFPEGQDAVFLPGKIHGCDDQLYILSFNPYACDEKGSWDIEVIDREGVLELIDKVEDNCDAFFELLPDKYQGRWYYCDAGILEFHSYCKAYDEADFLIGRDGELEEEYEFIKAWARGELKSNTSINLDAKFAQLTYENIDICPFCGECCGTYMDGDDESRYRCASCGKDYYISFNTESWSEEDSCYTVVEDVMNRHRKSLLKDKENHHD